MITKKEILEERINNEFWIDPAGNIIKYDINLCNPLMYDAVSLHYEIAHLVLPKAKYPQDSLTRLGWCKYGRVGIMHGVLNGNEIQLTQAQINTLERKDKIK